MKSGAPAMKLRMMSSAEPYNIVTMFWRVSEVMMRLHFFAAAPARLLGKFPSLECAGYRMMCTNTSRVRQPRTTDCFTSAFWMLLCPLSFPFRHLFKMCSAELVNGDASLLGHYWIGGIASATSSVIAVFAEAVAAPIAMQIESFKGFGFTASSAFPHAFDCTGGQTI